jgi:hypothetical protein
VAAQAGSPGVVNPSNGHTYYLTTNTNWVHAAKDAHRLGGRLATINDAAEQAWVFDTFSSYGGTSRLLWIGLTDAGAEGTFRWVSGEPVTYTNWAPGEPNDSGGGEHHVAMYYPGHSAQGRWNDWGWVDRDPIGIPFVGVVEVDPSRPGPTIFAEVDSTWLTIAPEGDRQGQPITAVGAAWEAANPGWRSEVNFDTSGWKPAAARGPAWWGPDAGTPLYLRKVFTLDGPVTDAMLLTAVDDDGLVYVNGTLASSDTNGFADGRGPIDVTSLLRVGQNLIAVKAHDSFGGAESMILQVSGTVVPEPAAAVAAVIIGAGLFSLRRRRDA